MSLNELHNNECRDELTKEVVVTGKNNNESSPLLHQQHAAAAAVEQKQKSISNNYYCFNKNILIRRYKLHLLIAVIIGLCFATAFAVYYNHYYYSYNNNNNNELLIPTSSSGSNVDNRNEMIFRALAKLNTIITGDVIVYSNKQKFKDAAQVWRNDMKPPLVVVEVANQDDVQKTIPVLAGLYKDFDFPFRIRSGGHHKAGYSTVEGGAVLSLVRLNSLTFQKKKIIPNNNNNDEYAILSVQPGAKVSDFVTQIVPSGYGSVIGYCSQVAEGGFVLGGGFGSMSRRYGLGIDNVEQMTIVLADGSMLKEVSLSQHEDLFWALRGAGSGNFGVVTEIQMRVYPTNDLKIMGRLSVPFSEIGTFLYKLGKLEPTVPGELIIIVNEYEKQSIRNDNDDISTVINNDDDDDSGIAHLLLSWAGDTDDDLKRGQEYFQNKILPLFSKVSSLQTLIFPWSSFPKMEQQQQRQQRQDLNFSGDTVYAAQAWCGYMMPNNNTLSIWMEIQETMLFIVQSCEYVMPDIELWSGAISNIPSNFTAFAYREALYNVGLLLIVPNGVQNAAQVFQEQQTIVNQHWGLISQHLVGSYVNYPMASYDKNEYARAYWGDNLERLVQVKQKYDPHNVFSYEQSVPLEL